MVTREEMLARKDEWLAKKGEIQASFSDRVDDPAFGSALGLSLVGAGAGTIIVNLIRHKRGALSYLIGAVFVVMGVAMLGSAYRVRSGRISEAEVQVREQLSALDPVARAQVLRDMASEQVAPFISRTAPSN
jgi:hypothetical protein